jgi:hypothetical protein
MKTSQPMLPGMEPESEGSSSTLAFRVGSSILVHGMLYVSRRFDPPMRGTIKSVAVQLFPGEVERPLYYVHLETGVHIFCEGEHLMDANWLNTIRQLLLALANYERWRPEGAEPEPCDFCHNTTEHDQMCPVAQAKALLAQWTDYST